VKIDMGKLASDELKGLRATIEQARYSGAKQILWEVPKTAVVAGQPVSKLDLSKLNPGELKVLRVAADEEKDRRSRRNPANHEPPSWDVPKAAFVTGQVQKQNAA
jgi:hypothetical protein